MDITSLPGNAYDYIYGNYGIIGLIVTALIIVVGIVSIFFWFDRRK